MELIGPALRPLRRVAIRSLQVPYSVAFLLLKGKGGIERV